MNAIALATALAALLLARPALAGIVGQPRPTPETERKIRAAVQLLLDGNDPGAARPALFLAVEPTASADIAELLAPIVADEAAYGGLAGIFLDALGKRPEREVADRLRYNLARLHWHRARTLDPTRRGPTLTAAAELLARLDKNLPDASLWEFAGDVEVERDELDSALVYYARVGVAGGDKVRASLKTGQALERRYLYDRALSAYQAGIRAAIAAGERGRLRHELHARTAGVCLAQGRDREALAALVDAAKVEQDPMRPFRFRLEAARALLMRGWSKEVAAYARAATAHAPDDEKAQALLAAAQRGR